MRKYIHLISMLVALAFITCARNDDKAEAICKGSTLQGRLTINLRVPAGAECRLDGFLYMTNGTRFTAEPGAVIKGMNSRAALIIEPGAKIFAEGTATNPVVFTSGQTSPAAGDWAGVMIFGNAGLPLTDDGDSTDDITGVKYGGSGNSAYGESSGTLRYVRIEYAGNASYTFSAPPINENFDGLFLGAVGSGTTVEYVQVYKSGDDGIKIKGGTVNLRYIVLNNNLSDQIEAKGAWQGSIQYAILIPGNSGSSNNGISLEENSVLQITNATILGNAVDELMKIKSSARLIMTNTYIAHFTNREIAFTNAATLDLIDSGQSAIRATLLENMSNSGNTYHQKGRVLLGECLDGIGDALIGTDYCCDAGDPGYDAPNKRCDVPDEANIVQRYAGSNLTAGDNLQQNPLNCVYLNNDCSGVTLVPPTPAAGMAVTGNSFFVNDARIGGAFNAWYAGWARRTDAVLY